jgi:hypothetical protein
MMVFRSLVTVHRGSGKKKKKNAIQLTLRFIHLTSLTSFIATTHALKKKYSFHLCNRSSTKQIIIRSSQHEDA